MRETSSESVNKCSLFQFQHDISIASVNVAFYAAVLMARHAIFPPKSGGRLRENLKERLRRRIIKRMLPVFC